MTSKSKTAPPAAPAPEATNGNPQNLYISVSSFDVEGRSIGERIVDMHHFGTRKWLQDHLWWSTHNGHLVEVNVATPEQIDNYLAAGKIALAEKFNNGHSTTIVEGANPAPLKDLIAVETADAEAA